jgi:uncharacterized membrane protein YbhN (UPF0104 family)
MRNLLFFVGKSGLAIILLGALIHFSALDLRLLVVLVQQPVLFSFALFLLLGVVVLTGYRWAMLNQSQQIVLSYRRSIWLTYVGVALNNITPAAFGGDMFRIFYISKRFPDKKGAAWLTVLADRVMGLIIVLLLITILGVGRYLALHHIPLSVWVGLPLMMGVGIWLALRVDIWLMSRFSLYGRIRQSIFRFNILLILRCLLISAVSQSVMTGVILVLSRMMGLTPLTFADGMLGLGVAQIASLIPLTPGGLGIGELAFANSMMWLNPQLGANQATVFFAYRLTSWLFYLPGTFGLLGKLRPASTAPQAVTADVSRSVWYRRNASSTEPK